MHRSLVSSLLPHPTAHKTACLLALVAFVALLAVACGGGTDKPPLTPDDPTANAMDAGDTPLADPNVTPAAPAAPAAPAH